MATYLYRLGRFAFRRRRLVAALWLALLLAAGAGAATLSGPTSNAFSIPGTESSRALDVIEDKLGSAGDVATARVVFRANEDLQAAEPKSAVEAAVAALAQAPQVASVADPYQAGTVSQDGRTAYATVTYSVGAGDVTHEAKEALFAAGDSAKSAGLEVEYGGDATQEASHSGATEVMGVLVAAVVLAITFGSLVAAGLPLLTAVVGVGLGLCGVQIATGFFGLSSSTSALALMLGLAVGIDYALFILTRYRAELANGHDGEEAAGRAVGTAGSAVVFAGLTVVIALGALFVVGIPFLTAMGVAAAGTVAAAVVIALTLLPAVLGFAGGKVLPKRARAKHEAGHVPFGETWGRAVVKARGPVLALAVVGLGVVALPLTDLRMALPDDSTAAPESTQRKAYDQLSAGFGAGFNGPLVLVVEAPAGQATAAAQQAKTGLAQLEDVVAVTDPAANPADDTALMTLVPGSGPSSEATQDLVQDIRDRATALTGSADAELMVTGTTALNIDVSQKLNDALIPYLAVVVGLAFLLLMLVFRSILVPLKATLGFLLSVAATFGAVVAVFQWGWLSGVFGIETTGPIVSLMPILLIGILFGLAMDYEVFLVAGMHEAYAHGARPDAAVVAGMRNGSRVVTAAALIMISVFFGFLLADDAIIKSLGFAFAAGVAIDAFVVRMTIVPAVLSLLGDKAWWLPRWLDRALPNVDVEGAKLAEQLQPAGARRELVDA
ncbi:MMPL family transporter [Motilibacter deserti]|uniref:MMPL family transporter n=1 Tax=Motilibacter deserti TaxID=2714956 RepID=A0ABX0GXV2_9ACTN|nr:MMPL family transporter [Motilibacter deserti]NHC15415.1 MMPL family transporter [Motilibacter deserti]